MDSLVTLIKSIEARPGMYLTGNSINLLNAFLSGFIVREPGTITDVNVLADFQLWVEKKYHMQHTQPWIKIILFHSHDEFDALENFFTYFNIFLEEREFTITGSMSALGG